MNTHAYFLKYTNIAKNERFINYVENVTTKKAIMLFHIMSFPYYVMYEASTLKTHLSRLKNVAREKYVAKLLLLKMHTVTISYKNRMKQKLVKI